MEGVITRVVIIAIEDEMRRPPMRRTDSLVVVGSWRKGRWVTARKVEKNRQEQRKQGREGTQKQGNT